MIFEITLSKTHVLFTKRIITNKSKQHFEFLNYLELDKNHEVNQIYQNVSKQFEYNKEIKRKEGEIQFSFVPYYIRQALEYKLESGEKYQGTCSDFGDLFRKSLKKIMPNRMIYHIKLKHKKNKRPHDATLLKYFNGDWTVISSITEKGTYQGPLSKEDLIGEFEFT